MPAAARSPLTIFQAIVHPAMCFLSHIPVYYNSTTWGGKDKASGTSGGSETSDNGFHPTTRFCKASSLSLSPFSSSHF